MSDLVFNDLLLGLRGKAEEEEEEALLSYYFMRIGQRRFRRSLCIEMVSLL